jgi:hypothetical protein
MPKAFLREANTSRRRHSSSAVRRHPNHPNADKPQPKRVYEASAPGVR